MAGKDRRKKKKAAPLLLDFPSTKAIIKPGYLLKTGEALMIASPIITLFINFWIGIVAFIIGAIMVVVGFSFIEPKLLFNAQKRYKDIIGKLKKRLN